MNSIAIDLGGTKIKFALISEAGKILARNSVPADSKAGILEQLEKIAGLVRGMMQEMQLEPSDFAGVSLAFPGIVDRNRNTVLQTFGKYTDASEVSLPDWSDRTFQLPLLLENDANAALAGETAYGCAKGETDVVLLILGTGIGTAAMLGGNLVRGSHFQAGCLCGHMMVQMGGRPCVCGNLGCAEAYASTWSLPLLAREHALYPKSKLSTEKVIDYRAVFQWAEQGDSLSRILLEQSLDCWGGLLRNLICAYDMKTIVLSGGVMHAGDRIRLPLQDRMHKQFPALVQQIRLVQSWSPEESVLYGLHRILEEELAH